MRNYTTQMGAAKRGIISPEMQAVAEKEYRTEEEIVIWLPSAPINSIPASTPTAWAPYSAPKPM